MKELLRTILVLTCFGMLLSCWSDNAAIYTGPPPRTTPLDSLGADDYKLQPLPESLFVEFTVPDDKDSCPVKVELRNSGTQLIRVVIDSVFKSGKYKIKWDKLDSNGVRIREGGYFYKYSICDSIFTYRMDFTRRWK